MARISRVLMLVVMLAATLVIGAQARAEERQIALVPLGHVDAALLQVARQAISAQVKAYVRVDAERELPQAAWYEPRKRWRAEKLLQIVESDPPPHAWKVVMITSAEISTTKGAIPDWRVGGLGNVGGTACVVSTWINDRTSKTKETLHRRLADLVIHELGHTLGLEHCPVAGCVMRDAKGQILQSQDLSTGRFCAKCREKLGDRVLR